MTKSPLLQTGALLLSLLTQSVFAAASADQIAKLGTTLTPLGAEKASNADGSIPAWTGGLQQNAGSIDARGFLTDPFANEQPLFTITTQNLEQYQDKLSPGQLAMFKRYADYKMPVYQSHRSVAVPPDMQAKALENAKNASLIEGGNGVDKFATSTPLGTTGQVTMKASRWRRFMRCRWICASVREWSST